MKVEKNRPYLQGSSSVPESRLSTPHLLYTLEKLLPSWIRHSRLYSGRGAGLSCTAGEQMP